MKRRIPGKRHESNTKKVALIFIIGTCIGIVCLWGLVIRKGQKEIQPTVASVNSEVPTEQEIPESTKEIEIKTYDPRDHRIHLVMVGDMLMHTRVLDSGKKEDGSYNYDHLFSHVKEEIADADLALVNQETILGGSEIGISSYPCFNSPYEVGDAEVSAGFDVILQATNHALDKGKAGIVNDIKFWKETYPQIAYLGINESRERQQNEIYVYEKDNMRIAILNYTYGTNGIQTPSDMPYAVNYLDESKVVADLAKAHELADFVIVCPHWGTEYRLQSDAQQKKWTQIFLENGVDLVIGTHPHVIEPIEYVSDEAGHQMLVYYSLGNFVNGTESTEGVLSDRMLGGIAEVVIGRGDNNRVQILDYDVDALVCHMGKKEAYSVYYLSEYNEELAKENLIRKQYPPFSYEYVDQLARKVWGDELVDKKMWKKPAA